MFRCGLCGKVSRPVEWWTETIEDSSGRQKQIERIRQAEKPVFVVTARREKAYPARVNANKAEGDLRFNANVTAGGYIPDPGGKGWEIVREVPAHQTCAAYLEDQPEDISYSLTI